MTFEHDQVLDAGVPERDGDANACGAAPDDDHVVDVLTVLADHEEIDLGGLSAYCGRSARRSRDANAGRTPAESPRET